MDGDTVVVGAFHDPMVGKNTGSAYVFVRSGTSWIQQAKLTAGAGELFGHSVSVNRHTVVVGAPAGDTAAGDVARRMYSCAAE